MTTCLELGTHFVDSFLNHGMVESVRICRFKTFLEQCFDKEPSCPFSLIITCKNFVLYIHISVEFAFDSCVEIS